LPKVCVIGGGLAGLSSAVFLKHYDADIDVTVIEASPKLGGRVYSFFDKQFGDVIDNGEHILASWYYSTLEMLKIVGTLDKLKFQQQMEVHLADAEGNRYLFKCPKLIPPLHLLSGIWKYRALRFNDRLGLIRLVNFLILRKYQDDELKAINLTELFEITNQPENLVKMFWEPFVLAVFNAKPENVSAWYFANIIRTGFFKKDGANLILPVDTLNRIFIESSEEYLKNRNTSFIMQTRTEKINFNGNMVGSVRLPDASEVRADYYISAVPFFEIENLIGEGIYKENFGDSKNLHESPIINIHHRYITNRSEEIFPYDFVGLLGTVIQWVFKAGKNHVCLIISGADDYIDSDKNELIELSKRELSACIPGFKNAHFISSRVIKEKRATFLPDIESLTARPANKTKFENFFIAGDWTDTGLPSTIESAVLSGRNCAGEIIKKFKG
jgi:squalene-associated FAD-dependent desaturase